MHDAHLSQRARAAKVATEGGNGLSAEPSNRFSREAGRGEGRRDVLISEAHADDQAAPTNALLLTGLHYRCA